MTDQRFVPAALEQHHPRLASLVEQGLLQALPLDEEGVYYAIAADDGRPILHYHAGYGTLRVPYGEAGIPFHYHPNELRSGAYFREDYREALDIDGVPVATFYLLGRTDLTPPQNPWFALHVSSLEVLSEQVREHPEIALDGYGEKAVTARQENFLEMAKRMSVEGLGVGIISGVLSRIVPVPGLSGALRLVARNMLSQPGEVKDYQTDGFDYAIGFPLSEAQLITVLTALDLWEHSVVDINSLSLFEGATADEALLTLLRVAGIDAPQALGMDNTVFSRANPLLSVDVRTRISTLRAAAGEPKISLSIPPMEEAISIHALLSGEGTPISLIHAEGLDKMAIYNLPVARGEEEGGVASRLYDPSKDALHVTLYLVMQALAANGLALAGGNISQDGVLLDSSNPPLALGYEPTAEDYVNQALLKAAEGRSRG